MSNQYSIAPEVLLSVIQNNPKCSICTFDVESTVFKRIVFDFAYAFIEMGTQKINGNKTFLNLDAIVDKQLLLSISSWNKIRNASNESYYGFFNLLKQEGWFSEEFSEKEIEERINLIYRDSLQKKLNSILNAKQSLTKKYLFWLNSGRTDEQANRNLNNRFKDVQNAMETEQLYKNLLENEESLANNLNVAQKEILSQKALQQLYDFQYANNTQNINKEQLKQQVKTIVNRPELLSWEEISTTFMKDIEKHLTCYITSYNLNADMTFIKNTNKEYKVNIIDPKVLSGFCSLILFKELKKNPKEILDLVTYKDPNIIKQLLSPKVDKQGNILKSQKGTATLDIFTSIFGTIPKIEGERHYALEDNKEFTEALANYIKYALKGLNKK